MCCSGRAPPWLLLLAAAARGQPVPMQTLPQAGLCSAIVGSPVIKQTHHDGLDPVQIINSAFRLPAGTITSWQLFNHGAAAPISLQAWRPVDDARSFQLVCHYDTFLIPGAQTIELLPPQGACDVEDGDSIGWWQSGGSVTGGIAYVSEPATDWDPGCATQKADKACATDPHKPECQCSVCNNRYDGVLWLYPQSRTAVGDKLSMNGCGIRTYSVSVEVSSECFAMDWGFKFLASLIGMAALYLGAGLAYNSQRGMAGHPHQAGWLHATALVQDGLAFVRAQGRKAPGRGARGESKQMPLLREGGDGGSDHKSSTKETRRGEKPKSGESKTRKKERSTTKEEKSKGRSQEVSEESASAKSKNAGGRWVHVPG